MKYFAYGMNTNLAQMAGRCPGAANLGAAWIDGYEFAFRTHADIVKRRGAKCHGVLWEIDEAHLQALDGLEGFPYYYTRFNVTAHTKSDTVTAIVYQMTDQGPSESPYTGYLNMVTEGYQSNGVALDQIDRAMNKLSKMQA